MLSTFFFPKTHIFLKNLLSQSNNVLYTFSTVYITQKRQCTLTDIDRVHYSKAIVYTTQRRPVSTELSEPPAQEIDGTLTDPLLSASGSRGHQLFFPSFTFAAANGLSIFLRPSKVKKFCNSDNDMGMTIYLRKVIKQH